MGNLLSCASGIGVCMPLGGGGVPEGVVRSSGLVEALEKMLAKAMTLVFELHVSF